MFTVHGLVDGAATTRLSHSAFGRHALRVAERSVRCTAPWCRQRYGYRRADQESQSQRNPFAGTAVFEPALRASFARSQRRMSTQHVPH